MDPDAWRSDLVLDLDFIVQWVCGVDARPRFRVAPATLTFHGVTDLHVHLDGGDSGFRVALHDVVVDRITRERVVDAQIFLDRPYFAWNVSLVGLVGGGLRFGAVGFTQVLRAAPVLQDEQSLAASPRPPF